MRTAQLAAAIVVAFVTAIPAAQAGPGRWTYHEESNDGHILAYVEDGKIVFELACGRGFSLLVKHPGQTKTDGKARITLVAGKTKLDLAGEYVPPAENSAANFYQSYLGYGKNDERVYGKKWQELESRLLDVIESKSGFTIAAGEANYQLRGVDIDKWRRPFELCGYGFWVSPREFPSETN
ncbi:hypothetical protein C2U70_12555 [Bradyrhizobium guangdongense]|uniref:hypothetical protein n=1 Tax=Bradyrhizobium guangdongense TaxID=1325090 RepID=UPI001126DCFE|nr:hypothetical protein [Bradyrhizobium guangdongense]TPQ36489.1 hypothetical protein C2U70_12555 [Bradyrhizobium guangdongense]